MTYFSELDASRYGELMLAGSAVYHLLIGMAALASRSWTARLSQAFYALDLGQEIDARFEVSLRFLGAYALFTGALCTLALLDPAPALRVTLLAALALLFFVRAVNRVRFRAELERAFRLGFRRSLVNVAFNCALTASIVAFAFEARSL